MKKKHLYALTVLLIILAAGALFFDMSRQRGSVLIRASHAAGSSDIICYLQSDPAWAEDFLGSSSYTMKSSGCLTTCLAAALQYEGITPETITGAADSIDPGALNMFLSKEHVYDNEGNIQWKPLENSDGKEFRCMDPMNPSDSLVPLSDFGNRIYAVRYIYRE